jgi:N-dimethylarginine dimethylaminohydrolase
VISLCLIDPRFHHLDTEEKRIPVSEPDALRFACNAVNVGRVILVNSVSSQLSEELEKRGFRVVQVPLTEFLRAGGAAKCLVLRPSEIQFTHKA